MAKIRNAQREYFFDLSEPGEGIVKGTKYIDLMQVHALCNRFSTRQGMEVGIESIEVGCQGGGAFDFTIQTLPTTWPLISGWEKTMRHWLKQQNEALEEAGAESMKAKYRDFKIFFDAAHQSAGVSANLIPSGFTITAPATGGYEWSASELVIPNAGGAGITTERQVFALGDDAGTGVGMIKAYAESRNRPHEEDPNIVTGEYGGILAAMQDVGDDLDQIVQNVSERNNEPPYIIDAFTGDEYYPGGSSGQGVGPIDQNGTQQPGHLVDILSISANQNYNSDQTIKSFTAPCGLLRLTYKATGVLPGAPADEGMPPSSFWMKVTLAPGTYKGIAARSMVEAN